MSTFTNVHAKPPVETASSDQAPRLRIVTNDPKREYAQRAGEVDRLPDSVAALILCKQGFNKVGRNGIKIELDGRKLNYWSENSVTIATKAGTDEKVLWTVNRQQPDVLHILSADGKYVESIPLEGRVPWFDAAATARELGAKTRANNRRIERVRDLHASDAAEALGAATQNGAQIKSVVNTFPADRSSAPGRRIPNKQTISRETIASEPVPLAPRISSADSIDREIGGRFDMTASPSAEDSISRAESASREAAGVSSEGDVHSSARGTFSHADRIHEVQRHMDAQRGRFQDRQRTIARNVAEVSDADIEDLIEDDSPNEVERESLTNQHIDDLADEIL